MAFHSALLHATALARLAVLGVVADFDDGPARARQAARLARLEAHVATLTEELRIKHARLARSASTAASPSSSASSAA
jgi:hypothetical protein